MVKARLKALDIGSGHKPVSKTGWWKEGDMAQYKFTNMDLYHEAAGKKWDFNEVPYPFRENHFDAVFARHTLEHVRREKLVDVMKEIHRVAKDKALVYIGVPYWNSEAFAGDPTHHNWFCETTFKHFCFGGSLDTEFYLPPLFEMVSLSYRFHPKFRFLPRKLLKELMHVLSGVCDEIWVTLRVVKSEAKGIEYAPETAYSFNEPVHLRIALFYGAIFYGGIGIALLAILSLFLQLLRIV